MKSFFVFLLTIFTLAGSATPLPLHDLDFDFLSIRWDEAVPLGNGMVGALVWQEGDRLRFSLDRADLWDRRPVENFQKPEFCFDWMYEQFKNGDIGPVQDLIDRPYNDLPAPTKIPAGRLEFDQTALGKVENVQLDISKAECKVVWSNGAVLKTFVHAMKPVGWFFFEGVDADLKPVIIPPPFGGAGDLSEEGVNSLSGHDLRALGYTDPIMETGDNYISYLQEGWGEFQFAIYCQWEQIGHDRLVGVWSIISTEESADPQKAAQDEVQAALIRKGMIDFGDHTKWWNAYWDKSSVNLPDKMIEKQWYMDTYKFGCTARRGAPPISLQAIWTADERRIPPWKGDYHHDLNTQLSYWPCYSGNRLAEGLSFLDWLWKIKPTVEAWTEQFYKVPGLNVPGMTTIEGEPMGGWHQYSCSPTTSAWLAQHFYWHWRYSMDKEFLKTRAYPWLRETAVFLDKHSIRMEDGMRRLPLSSSPEIGDNRIEAWFEQTTNYDLALIRWLYMATEECARELGLSDEANRWTTILSQWPQLAMSKDDQRLLVAPGMALIGSHRHFSHLMAIYPLGLLKWEDGPAVQKVIRHSLDELERLGPDWWCGYSYAWLASLAARAHDGNKASDALRIFAECFVSKNTFHLNGDQSKSGKSKFLYRPFTLEGNFAFANGVQEMLLQSHANVVEVFPAIPNEWETVSFSKLRAQGAFLISASRVKGQVEYITVTSETGGTLRLSNSFGDKELIIKGIAEESMDEDKQIIIVEMNPGDTFTIHPKKTF